MANCDKFISKNIETRCTGLNQGAENEGLIMNRADIEAYQIVSKGDAQGVANTIANIALKDGKRAYKIKQLGNTPFTGTQTSIEVGTYVNTFTHNVGFVIMDEGPEVASDIIEPIANGHFIIILKVKNSNVVKTGEQTTADYCYRVYGLDQGLHVSEGSSELYSDDTLGGWAITMEETKTPHAAVYTDKDIYEQLEATVVA